MNVERGDRMVVNTYLVNAAGKQWKPGSIVYVERSRPGEVYARTNPHGSAVWFSTEYVGKLYDKPRTKRLVLKQMHIGDQQRIDRRAARHAPGRPLRPDMHHCTSFPEPCPFGMPQYQAERTYERRTLENSWGGGSGSTGHRTAAPPPDGGERRPGEGEPGHDAGPTAADPEA